MLAFKVQFSLISIHTDPFLNYEKSDLCFKGSFKRVKNKIDFVKSLGSKNRAIASN
jgi:hypothetical protein